MNKTLSLLVMVLIQGHSIAQNFQQEINNHVWKVQLEAMKEGNPEKFISVMSDDVVQVSYDRNTIRNKKEFHQQAILTYNRIKERKWTRDMDFKFLNRIANNSTAFEDGFYKYELTDEKLEKRVFYGYFQVTLRKEKEVWKVLVDYDSDHYNGTPVTIQMFENAKPLDQF